MSYQDKTCICRDCKKEFTFTADEQKTFEERGFQTPARCPECREKRNPRRKRSQGSKAVEPRAQEASAPQPKNTPQRKQQPKRQEPKPRQPRVEESKPAETFSAPCSVCYTDVSLKARPTGLLPVYCPKCFEERMNAKENPGYRDSAVRKREKISRDAYKPLADLPSERAPLSDTSPPASSVATLAPPARPVTSAPVQPKPETSTAPAVSMSSFSDFGLDERLERAVEAAGYDVPTPVQNATIPIGMSGRDLIGTAQTGTGKTAAFVLPILHHLLANPVKKPCTRVIVVTPTRELAEQINETFKQLGRFTRIKTATVYGGVGMVSQERALRTGAEVIVACPGRLLDHVERGNCDFSGVEKVVLDEADRMLDMGFLPPIRRILSLLPRDRHTMLFSATFAQELTQLARETLNNPQRVDVDLCAPPKTIAHALYPCPQHLKTSLVLKLLDKTDTNSVLIFTRTKHRANRVAKQIAAAGYKADALHSNKSQNQRQSALDGFRSGRCQILVATDIAARGLDVETISHVINYDIPDTADTYIHRIGRTGRAEREGDAMTLITKDDSAMVWDIEKALGAPIERIKLDDFDYNAAAPVKDEFKRDPLPPRRPRLQSSDTSSAPHPHSPARQRATSTQGHFTGPRKHRPGKITTTE